MGQAGPGRPGVLALAPGFFGKPEPENTPPSRAGHQYREGIGTVQVVCGVRGQARELAQDCSRWRGADRPAHCPRPGDALTPDDAFAQSAQSAAVFL